MSAFGAHRLRSALARVYWHRVAGMTLLHAAAVYGLFVGLTTPLIILCAVLYVVRMFGVTAGYHCYFSHRAFRTSRVFQFFLAVLAQSSGLGGALTWAAYHRHHHRHTDTSNDLHSPARRGVWCAHLGWVFDNTLDGQVNFTVADFRRYRELDLLDKWGRAPLYLLAGICACFGSAELLFSFAMSTALIIHATFAVNSLAHIWGSKNFETGDESRNNWFVAIIMLGGGWHNNHHYYPRSARQGFFWWEVDITYYTLKVLEFFGLVWDVREPPARVLAERRR